MGVQPSGTFSNYFVFLDHCRNSDIYVPFQSSLYQVNYIPHSLMTLLLMITLLTLRNSKCLALQQKSVQPIRQYIIYIYIIQMVDNQYYCLITTIYIHDKVITYPHFNIVDKIILKHVHVLYIISFIIIQRKHKSVKCMGLNALILPFVKEGNEISIRQDQSLVSQIPNLKWLPF